MKRPLPSETGSANPVGGLRSRLFAASMLLFVGLFALGWLALLAADVSYTNTAAFTEVLTKPETLAALWLSLWTSTASVVIGLVFAVPMGYALSRYRFPGHALADSIVELADLVAAADRGSVALGLLPHRAGAAHRADGPAVRFPAAGDRALSVPRVGVVRHPGHEICFDGIDVRLEHVAMTLGCTRFGAFWRVAFPLARRGMVAGGILMWTRAFGLFRR